MVGGAAAIVMLVGCGSERPVAQPTVPSARPAVASAEGDLSLAQAAGASYRVRASDVSAVVQGHVRGGGRLATDTLIVPNSDVANCHAFSERRVPSRDDGVGDAVVWLDGVGTGLVNDAPRRATLRLTGCRLTPRVQRVAAGGTVLISSADAIHSQLSFREYHSADSARDVISFTDDGQSGPSSRIAARPGLVEVRDALHPWVHGWIAVTPHPYVAVTDEDGAFRFEGVPAGTYTLVVWNERLGQRTRQVRVTRRGDITTDITFR